MKGRAVEPRAVRRVHVDARAAAPLLATRDQLALDDALRAEVDAHIAVGVLPRRGHDDADRLLERRHDLGVRHDLLEVRGADLLLALGDEDDVHGHLLARALDRVQRREERGLGTLLVDRASAHQHLPEAWLVDDRRLERR